MATPLRCATLGRAASGCPAANRAGVRAWHGCREGWLRGAAMLWSQDLPTVEGQRQAATARHTLLPEAQRTLLCCRLTPRMLRPAPPLASVSCLDLNMLPV